MLEAAMKMLLDLKRPETVTVEGVEYVLPEYQRFSPPAPKGFTIHTLQGLVDYVNGKDKIEGAPLFAHVVTPSQVVLMSALDDTYRSREVYATVELSGDVFQFGRHLETPQFIIGLQSMFVQDETTAMIMALAGNVVANAELRVEDDGVSQSVTAKAGIASVERRAVPNPVTLRPFRTFREVEQPASQFVFRLKGGTKDQPEAALFEADGGAWKLQAIENIAAFIREKLPTVVVLA